MRKQRILAWVDSPTAGTGYGQVALHVLRGLYQTGHFDIDQLGISYFGEFYDQAAIPWRVVPAQRAKSSDVFGKQSFLELLGSGRYDYVWIYNDTYMLNKIARHIPKVKEYLQLKEFKIPKIILCFPVDCQFRPEWDPIIRIADHLVTPSEYGKMMTLRSLPDLKSKLAVIPHGVAADFYPIPKSDRAEYRKKLLGINDPSTFVVVNVNRNSLRKQIPRTIQAFARFRKTVPNSKLYLHTAMIDDASGYDLGSAALDLHLTPGVDVLFTPDYKPSAPVDLATLNSIYNVADCYLTTTLGEGWGLTHLEAMAVGLPVICPENTVFPEHLANGQRGYLYPCAEEVWVDNSGFRKSGTIDSIVATMKTAHDAFMVAKQSGTQMPQVSNGFAFIKTLDWNQIVEDWVELFDRAADDSNSQVRPIDCSAENAEKMAPSDAGI